MIFFQSGFNFQNMQIGRERFSFADSSSHELNSSTSGARFWWLKNPDSPYKNVGMFLQTTAQIRTGVATEGLDVGVVHGTAVAFPETPNE